MIRHYPNLNKISVTLLYECIKHALNSLTQANSEKPTFIHEISIFHYKILMK